MRILDKDNNELTDSSELQSAGKLVKETINTVFHAAVEAIEETGHYETVAEYDNGGKDVAWVVDTPGRAAREEYWETEDILRFVPFTAEEIKQKKLSELKTELAGTDNAILEGLESVLRCKSVTDLLAVLAKAAIDLQDVLDIRTALREEIMTLTAQDAGDKESPAGINY